MKTIRRPISILLAVLMVVGMFTMVPISAGATVYTENEIGEYVTTGDIIHLQGDYIEFETYSVVLKGGTYKVAGSNEVAQSDIQLGEAWSGSGVTVHSDGFRYNGTKYVPVDANGYESGSWLVLDVNNDDGVITFRGMCDYYLAGTMNMWDTNDGTYELAKNPGNTDEYMLLDFAADANTEFKVVSVGEYIAPTNNFTLNEAGTYDIYFRPNGGGNTADGWVDGKVFANNFRPASSATYVAQIGDTKYETLDAAITAAQAGDTVKLLENVTLTEALVIPEGKNFTLDLNGKDITGNVNDKLVQNNGTVVVDDTSAAPGHIYNTNIDKQGNAAFVNYGTATVKNGYFGDKNSDMTDANDVNRGAGFQNQGTAVIDGGYFTACDNFTPAETGNNGYAYAIINYGDITINDATVYGKNNGNLANDAGTMTVNGGNFSLVKGAKKNYYSIYNGSDSANSIVNGGTFTNTTGTALTHTGVGTTELNGGSFTYTKFEQSKTGHPTVSGGTFNKAVPEAYCAEGFIPVTNTDGTYTVDGPYVAKIGTTGYATLADAFAAAVDDDTITVLANSAGNGIKVTPAGKFATNGLTVDFAGHTYTVDGETVGSTGTETNGFQLLKNNKVTFKNGTITSAKAKILVQNYSDLTLEGMTLTLNNPDYTEAYTLSNNNGNIVIDGTTINANPAGGFAFDVCRFSSYPSVHVKVTGESVINGDVEVSASKGQAKDGFSLTLESGSMSGAIVVDASAQALVGEVNKVTKKDTFAKEAPEGFKWVSNEDGTSSLAPIPYVAKIGNAKYETLADAFAAAVDGDTITLLANCAGNGIKVTPAGKFATGLTVDFAGFTYTVDGETVGSTGTETNGFQLLKNNKVTFKNGTITSAKAKILVQNYSDLTLEGMTLTLNNPDYTEAYTLSNNNGNIVIDGTTINANPAGGFAFDVCRFSSYPSVHVKVTGESVINGDVEVSASKGQAKDGFSLTLESGSMSGAIVVDASAQALVGEVNKVTKKDTFAKEAPEGFKWVSNEDGTSSLAPIPYVAQIGNTKYETLEAAFAAAVDGDTITVLADSAGNGIQVLKNKFKTKGLTVDFDHHTYTMDGATVGSPGTATQAFQLQYGNKITFKNGTLYSEKALFLVQNYSNLTLDGMTLTLNNPNYAYGYTLSNNYGNTVIKDTTINANPAGKFAFDVCRGGGSNAYKYVHVTVTDNSVINGNVEVDARNGDPRDGFSLNLESGTLNGEIKLTANAETAIDNNPDNASVNKKNTFNQDPAAGYKWKDNGDGTSTLVKIPKLFAGNGLALHGDIGVIFYLNPEAAGFSLNQVSSVSVDFACDKYSGTVTEFTKDDATGCIKVAYYVPVAYMASDIIASNVKINNLPAIGTDTYSVQTYALDTINDPNAPAARKTLMKEMLNYGAKAKAVFESQMANPEDAVYEEIPDYTKTTVTVDMIDDAIEGEATDMSTVTPEPGAKFYGSSVIYLSETTLRMVFAIPDGSGSKLPENAYTGHQGKWYHWVDKKDIPAAQLHKQQTFTVGNATFNYSALDYAKAVLNSNMDQANKDLVSAMYLYNQAAIACFA